MFEMFGFGGTACPRCERKNSATSGYCTGCGLTLGAPRNRPLLRDNRWIAGPDELAVYFGVRELSGIFVKTLRVPQPSDWRRRSRAFSERQQELLRDAMAAK